MLRTLYQEPDISRMITGTRVRWEGLTRRKVQKNLHANI